LPVAVNVTGLPVRVPEVAVTLLVPGVAPKVKVEEAKPCAFVVTGCVGEIVPPPLATANVTETPETGTPLASVTKTVNGTVKAVPCVPVWLFPPALEIVVAAPAVVPGPVIKKFVAVVNVPLIVETTTGPEPIDGPGIVAATMVLLSVTVKLSAPNPAMVTAETRFDVSAGSV